jgi:hypothetical protein
VDFTLSEGTTMTRALKVVDSSVEAATNEAAREARAEAQAEADKKAAEPKATTPRKRPSSVPADGWHRFVVDVWITDINFTEFGVYKRSRNKAKSRQFTTDMDVFAEIIEDGERTGLLGYREDLWKQATGMDKRLVFKLFSENLTWRATADLMLGRSIQQTIGARGLPVMTYSINTDEDQYMIYVERSANKWPLLPEYFSFFIIDEKGQPEFYRLRRDVINLGGDYTLYNQRGENVGHLDGKVFSIGGKWKGKVQDGPSSKRLLTVMKLFAGMIVFNGDCRRHMKSLYRDIQAGRIDPKLERQEADLYMNPRRVR